MPSPNPSAPPGPWKRVSATAIRLFHDYANWLVGISWKRFIALSLLLMILASILQHVPPFRWAWTEVRDDTFSGARTALPAPPASPLPPPAATARRAETAPQAVRAEDDDGSVVISIDGSGVHIAARAASGAASATPQAASAPRAASSTDDTPARLGAAAPGPDNGASSAPTRSTDADATIRIELPGASRETLRAAARAAREAVEDARRDAAEARRDAAATAREARQSRRTRVVHLGDSLTDLAFFWIVASAILKAVYKGRVQAEVQAAAATETAESEQLKRQVVEARMAAMQAQVEPHFLFNTLASIDHLIETDPPRASQMQKNLIALLRASMPAMRENHPTAHTLGRELAVIRPYLEILKVRMEDRLQTEIEVPAGLLSAEFPPMMIQGLVENAIKHGLEPKAEGGRLVVSAEIIDGRLAVSVADTGLGFGAAATAGTGTGLANLRERLQLMYGARAALTIGANTPSGTRVTLTVPYVAQAEDRPNVES